MALEDHSQLVESLAPTLDFSDEPVDEERLASAAAADVLLAEAQQEIHDYTQVLSLVTGPAAHSALSSDISAVWLAAVVAAFVAAVCEAAGDKEIEAEITASISSTCEIAIKADTFSLRAPHATITAQTPSKRSQTTITADLLCRP